MSAVRKRRGDAQGRLFLFPMNFQLTESNQAAAC
jgi:hypothetical protein